MKILSWNILADEWVDKNDYNNSNSKFSNKYDNLLLSLLNRKKRIQIILKHLLKYDCDIIMLQEVMKMEYDMIKELYKNKYKFSDLKSIKWSGFGKSGNIIIVRNNICNDLKFFYRKNYIYAKCLYKHRKFIMINLHLDDINEYVRINQIKNILENINHNTCIICGDFNENYNKNKEIYSLLHKNNFHISNKKINTYLINKPEVIDNVIYRGFEIINMKIEKNIKDPITQLKKYGSDHYPVFVELHKSEKYN